MPLNSLIVLVSGLGLIAFLGWFFLGMHENKRSVTKAAATEHAKTGTPTVTGATGKATPALERCDLTISGMHCAACIGRVEKALQRVPGVQSATVNLLSERASVQFDPKQTQTEDLVASVYDAGYDASLAHLDYFHTAPEGSQPETTEKQTEAQELLRRFVISLSLTIPVLVMGMGPHIGLIPMHWTMLVWWNWVQLCLTTPVLLWAGSGFFRGAWAALKQRASDMNTLIVVGTSAAYVYLSGGDGSARLLHSAWPQRGVYYETAAVIITLILMGRLLEAQGETQHWSRHRETNRPATQNGAGAAERSGRGCSAGGGTWWATACWYGPARKYRWMAS